MGEGVRQLTFYLLFIEEVRPVVTCAEGVTNVCNIDLPLKRA